MNDKFIEHCLNNKMCLLFQRVGFYRIDVAFNCEQNKTGRVDLILVQQLAQNHIPRQTNYISSCTQTHKNGLYCNHHPLQSHQINYKSRMLNKKSTIFTCLFVFAPLHFIFAFHNHTHTHLSFSLQLFKIKIHTSCRSALSFLLSHLFVGVLIGMHRTNDVAKGFYGELYYLENVSCVDFVFLAFFGKFLLLLETVYFLLRYGFIIEL